MRQALQLLKQAGFFKRSLDELAFETNRVIKGSYINGKYDDLDILKFSDKSDGAGLKVMCDSDIGGFSKAQLEIIDTRSPISTSESCRTPTGLSGRSFDDAAPTSTPTTSESLPSSSEGSMMTSDTASIGILDPPIYASFHGTINLDLPSNRPDIQRSGYAGFRQIDPKATIFGTSYIDIDHFRYLALRIKSDSRKYFVNIQTDSIISKDLHQHRLLAKSPGKWETVVIPVKDFVRTRNGWVVYPIQGMLTRKVKTMGFSVTDRVAGPFELCVERIWATNTPPVSASSWTPKSGEDGELELD